MTQDISQPEGGEHSADEQKPVVAPEIQALIDAILKDPARTATEIKNLRAEAKQRRLDAEANEHKRQQEETARLEAAQEWKQAAEAYKQQLADLTPKAQRVDETDQFLKNMVERRVESLLPHYRKLVPDYDDPRKTLQWLEDNASALNLPKPANIDAGQRGDSGGMNPQVAKLSAEELALATQAGMTPEQFAQYKFKAKPDGVK